MELIVGAGTAADFYALTPRMALSPARATGGCRVTFVAFDLLYLDGRDVCRLPYVERRALLQGLGVSPKVMPARAGSRRGRRRRGRRERACRSGWPCRATA